jgi:hypothetical protein
MFSTETSSLGASADPYVMVREWDSERVNLDAKASQRQARPDWELLPDGPFLGSTTEDCLNARGKVFDRLLAGTPYIRVGDQYAVDRRTHKRFWLFCMKLSEYKEEMH